MIIRRTLVLVGLAVGLAAPLASAQTIDHADVGAMVNAINAERARTAVSPLTEDPRLDAIAEAHSMEMVRARYFSHESPTTGQPSDRVTHAGLHWNAVAENIALNQSPETAQQALLHSPGHHENMVDPAQRSLGIGIVRQGDQVWVTQLFATLTDPPLAAPPAVPAVTAPVATAPAPTVDADDEDTADESDDAPVAPTAPVAPMAPVASAAPQPPVAPSITGLPLQGIPGLDQFLTGLGLARQPAAPTRSGRAAPATQVYTVQTPFGPVRVEVPGAFTPPSATAASNAPVAAPVAHPARAPRAPHAHPTAPARGRVVEVAPLDV